MNKEHCLIKEYYENRFRLQFEKWIKNSHAHEVPGEGIYIPSGDLDEKNLLHIPWEDKTFFFSSLGWTVLIDQVMYTYFKKDYPKFQSLTLYPKIELGLTGINISPRDIFRWRGSVWDRLEYFSFFLSDLRQFFEENAFEEANWDTVTEVMIGDEEVMDIIKEEILKKTGE